MLTPSKIKILVPNEDHVEMTGGQIHEAIRENDTFVMLRNDQMMYYPCEYNDGYFMFILLYTAGDKSGYARVDDNGDVEYWTSEDYGGGTNII